MSVVYEIPLDARSQKFTVTLSGVDYLVRFTYRQTGNVESSFITIDDDGGALLSGTGDFLTLDGEGEATWILDVGTVAGQPLVCGIPLLPGVDLLAQYPYLGIGGQLYVVTPALPETIPAFGDLGISSHLYYVDNTDAA